jgi:hypothetical protein
VGACLQATKDMLYDVTYYGDISDAEEYTLEELQASAEMQVEDNEFDDLVEIMDEYFEDSNPGAARRSCFWLH